MYQETVDRKTYFGMMISRRPAALMPDGPSGQWRAFRQVRVTAWLSTGSPSTISPSRLNVKIQFQQISSKNQEILPSRQCDFVFFYCNVQINLYTVYLFSV
jgi:hypothetical protein